MCVCKHEENIKTKLFKYDEFMESQRQKFMILVNLHQDFKMLKNAARTTIHALKSKHPHTHTHTHTQTHTYIYIYIYIYIIDQIG